MPRGVYTRKPRTVHAQTIRQLQPGDPIPEGEPRRYRDRQGYIRLRWRIGLGEQVEVREHRVLRGYVIAADREVHHKDHDPANNDPANLVVLTPAEHSAIHSRERLRFDRAEAVRLYADGWSTPDIGTALNVNPATVYRALVALGVQMRSPSEGSRLARSRRAA